MNTHTDEEILFDDLVADTDNYYIENVRYHTITIKIIRVILPFVALMTVIGLFVWPFLNNDNPAIHNKSQNPDIKNADQSTLSQINNNQETEQNPSQIEMTKPRFDGIDNKKRPFTITADRILQKDGTPNSDMTLINPVADITLPDNIWLAISSKSGLYSQREQTLFLQNDVSLFHDNGYTLSTTDMHIDLNNGIAKTDTPAHLQGAQGIIDGSKGMMVNDFGKNIIFYGPAKMTLYGKIN